MLILHEETLRLFFTEIASFFLFSFKDGCKEYSDEIILFSYVNEIDIRDCPLIPNEKRGTIIWYKNDSKTPISIEQDSRIHQQNERLWFVPAKMEDSGHYYCVVR